MNEEETEITLHSFSLYYDGIYRIKFVYDGESFHEEAFIPPNVLFKMLQIEGVPGTDFNDCSMDFRKVTITLPVYKDKAGKLTAFRTTERAERLDVNYGLTLIDLGDPNQVSA